MGERGAAILLVLWSLALVSGLAVAAGGAARVETRVARNLLSEAEARHAAEAGLYHAVLLAMRAEAAPAPDQALDLELMGARIGIRMRDACGKADLNTGSAELIRRVVAAVVPERRAAPIADAILDWRDPDGRPRAHGAEAEAYDALGLGHGARDGPFEAVDELQHVRGVTPEVFEALRPLVTVDCLNAGIDPLHAPPRVLAAITRHGGEAALRLLRWRQAAARGVARAAPRAAFEAPGLVESAPGHAFEITATARLPSGATVARQAVVLLTGDAERPFVLRDLRPGGDEAARGAADSGVLNDHRSVLESGQQQDQRR